MTKITSEILSEVKGGTEPVKVGDRVLIVNCSNCPETNGKVGTVIRDKSLEDNPMFELDVPSNHYGEYTLMDSEFDVWALISTEEEEPEEAESESDAVSRPSHYTAGKTEVIDIIAQTVSGYDNPFVAHCVGTATKYLNRAPYKHDTPTEDLRKAVAYLNFAIKHLEEKAEKEGE
ncbi:DUF3310 domain-containing protein [Oceanobacillus sojae]|uniref:DUF3310 domain-containing protein n=1 Tax=Oceanobacillus sojae TaxID=582851 RepID=UPI00363E30E1